VFDGVREGVTDEVLVGETLGDLLLLGDTLGVFD
jgi:hypothetical protein